MHSAAHDRDLRTWSDDLDRIAAQTQRPLPTCAGCRHFTPDTINPVSGLGWCPLRNVARYPMQRHRCRQREERV